MAKKRDNEDELCAKDWLRQQGYEDIQQPDNDPPDFVVDGVYAVEVTRLNQRIVVGHEGIPKGEEEARIPLTDCIAKAICRLGPPGNEGYSWVIDCEYNFSEPLPTSKIVTRQISEALAPLLQPYDMSVVSDMVSKYLDHDKHAGEIPHLKFPHLCLDCGICLELGEFSHSPAKFLLQNVSDGYGIGFPELNASIQNRILEKSTGVHKQDKVGKYKSWWLILVDHVCHFPMTFLLSKDELSSVSDQCFDFWSRVTIISSRNPGWHYELLSR